MKRTKLKKFVVLSLLPAYISGSAFGVRAAEPAKQREELSIEASTEADLPSLNDAAEALMEESHDLAMSFSEQAEAAQESLWDEFWNESKGFLMSDFPAKDDDKGHNYWWFAHAIDALVDGYERSGDEKYLERAKKVAEGVYYRTGHSFVNDFYDDMDWMGLALLRLYDQSGDEFYLEQSQRLFREVSAAWSGIAGGGIAWNRSTLNFKNTPSNAPAVILAARLYERTQDEAYRDWATKIFDYVHEHLREDDGYVIDGLTDARELRVHHEAYTYNHGTYIGAATKMYLMTGDESYLDYADQTFDNAAAVYLNARGVITENGEGDGGLFKGILLRYVTRYYFIHPEHPEKVRRLILNNAAMARERAVNDEGLVADRWMGPPKQKQQLSSHLSGVMLFEAAWKVAAGVEAVEGMGGQAFVWNENLSVPGDDGALRRVKN